jgi:hypothetical protein
MVVLITLVLSAAVLSGMSPSAAPGSRTDGLDLPQWATGDFWEYRDDVTNVAPRAIFNLTYLDTQTTGGPFAITAEMRFTATTHATQTKLTVVGINTAAREYKLNDNNWTWENGTWTVVVIDNGGDPAVLIGDTVVTGSYKFADKCVGDRYLDMNTLDLKRDTFTCMHQVTANGGLSWTEDVTSTVVESTQGGNEAVFKPTWNAEPLQVGDKWKQNDTLTVLTDLDYVFGGDIAGQDTMTTTANYRWDFAWQVMSMGPRTIASTKSGTNKFATAAQVVRSGSYDWDYTDGTTVSSGHVKSVRYEYWYGCAGDVFDSGWYIELNYSTRIISSNHNCFENTPPKFASPPPAVITINCDELWAFKNGVDYAVSDPDPGNAGQLSYSLKKRLGTNENVLLGLSIDPDTGGIQFTPPQLDVADGYTLTINVTDHYDNGPLASETSFTLNIKNKNHAPTINQSMLKAITMNEGKTSYPDWNLTDVAHDPDMNLNPLMGNQPYDPKDRLFFNVTGNNTILVKCADGKDLNLEPSCPKIYLNAPDLKFPKNMTYNLTFKATDYYGMKAVGNLSMTVKHVNHVPAPVMNGPPEVQVESNTDVSIDLGRDFKDPDIGDLNYITGDTLVYSSDPGQNLTIVITGSNAKLMPREDWCGKENITFRATDRAGAPAKKTLTLIVQHCGPQFDIITYSPTSDPVLQEGGGPGTAYPGSVTFTIEIRAKNSPLMFKWTVEDKVTGKVYDPSIHDPSYVFETAYDEDFYNGRFFGGDTTRDYTVTVYVTNGKMDVLARTWLVTVRNTDRPPTVTSVTVYKYLETGATVTLPKSSTITYYIENGRVYKLDASAYIDDEDERIGGHVDQSRLTIEWLSDADGLHATGPSVNVVSGSTVNNTYRLKNGEIHHLVLRVTDKEGATAQLNVTLIVQSQGSTTKTTVQEAPWGILPLVLIIIAVVATIIYRTRRS